MRKLILTLLLASTAAMPALAQDRDGDRRDRRSESSRSDDGDRARPARTRARAERAERAERPSIENVRERIGERVRERRAETEATQSATIDQPRPRLVRQSNAQETQTRRGRGDPESLARRIVEERRERGGPIVTRDRVSSETRDRDQTRRHRDGDRQWSNHWRSDRRYDWRRYRSSNRSLFRFGRYYDPYGYSYGYRRFTIGLNLWPSYYRSSFWLNDPWQYRLPPAYGPYRWVRYYNDALLVNIYTGRVVDVEYNFFW